MKAILVPVDGSQSSLRAVRNALSLMEGRNDITLHVINVQPPIVSGNVKRYFSEDVLQAYYQDEGENALRPALNVLDEAGVPYRHKVEVGPIAATITGYAQQHHCDHIVMGTRGLGSVSGLILGSITTKVLKLTDVPVTLVK